MSSKRTARQFERKRQVVVASDVRREPPDVEAVAEILIEHFERCGWTGA
jgi:hypothetical protein